MCMIRYVLLGELQPAHKVRWNDKNRGENIDDNLKKKVYIYYKYILDEIFLRDM